MVAESDPLGSIGARPFTDRNLQKEHFWKLTVCCSSLTFSRSLVDQDQRLNLRTRTVQNAGDQILNRPRVRPLLVLG